MHYIEQKIAEINAVIERTQREIELIEEYRTTLIAHAVTGKIDVRPGASHAARALHHSSHSSKPAKLPKLRKP